MRTRRSRSVRFAALAVAAAGGFVACGGSTTTSGGGNGTLTGSVGSTTFSVQSQLAAIQAESSTCTGSASSSSGGPEDAGETCTSSGQVVIVLLTNRADASCATAQSEEATGANIEFANFDELELLVGVATGTVTTGTFAVVGPDAGIPTGPVAAAQFGTTDATCTAALDANGTSGSITLTQLSATTVSGTYDVAFGTQGSFSGSFDVDLCQLPDGGGVAGDGGPPTCK